MYLTACFKTFLECTFDFQKFIKLKMVKICIQTLVQTDREINLSSNPNTLVDVSTSPCLLLHTQLTTLE